jgi:hypothetical protein
MFQLRPSSADGGLSVQGQHQATNRAETFLTIGYLSKG